MNTAILSSAYFGPVQWYQKLARYERVLIDPLEPFQKQTYRNRCIIATTNGTQALTVPIVHQPLTDTNQPPTMEDIRISDHGNWRHLHWNALVSAYGESPFFEYYADDLRPFFEQRWEFLFDFNLQITLKMCELLDISPNTSSCPSSFVQGNPQISDFYAGNDFRQSIRPKHPLPDAEFQPKPYYQVFSHKHGFLPNMSILDLLFNMGNESIFWLI